MLFPVSRHDPVSVHQLKTLLLLVLIVAMTAAPAIAAPPAGKAQQVIIAPVSVEQIYDRVEALGTTRANESVNITASVTEKVKRVAFEDDQFVEAGSILAVLDNDEEQANLQQANAVLGERQLALERLRRLEKKQLAPTDELDRARLAVEQAKASISAIQARISDRIIRAPFSGKVGLRNISKGALVETGDLIATLDDISVIKLDFTVPSVFLPSLKADLPIEARADALPDKTFKGTVNSIDSRVDPVTRSVRVRAILPNPDNSMIPGLLMKVILLHNERQGMLIPESALLPLGDKQFVLVVSATGEQQTVKKQQITIGMRLPGRVEVIEGLATDDRVVTHGNNKLRPGQAITILGVDDGQTDISAIIRKTEQAEPKP